MKRLILMLGFAANYLIIFAQHSTDACLSAKSLRIVVLGSSTAEGVGPSVPDSAWVNRYRAYMESLNPANEVINLAKSGYTTYHLMPSSYTPPTGKPLPDTARNVTKAISFQPDGIVINMPSNDAYRYYGASEQLGNFQTVYDSAVAHGIPVWICTPQPRNFDPVRIQIQLDLRDSINATFGMFAIDFWTGIALASNGRIDPIYNKDNIHLNDAGHNVLFQRVLGEMIPRHLTPIGTGFDYFVFPPLIPDITACGDSNTVIRLPIGNIGQTDTTALPVVITLRHTASGAQTTFLDTIQAGLASCASDTLLFTYNTYAGGTIEATAFALNPLDRDSTNNDTSATWSFIGHPTIQTTGQVICDSGSTVLAAVTHPQDTIVWYDMPTGGSPIHIGSQLPTPMLTASQTYYAEAVRGPLYFPESLLSTKESTTNWNGAMFDLIGYDNLTVDSLAIKINTLGSQTVMILQKPKTYQGFEHRPLSWALHDSLPVMVTSQDSLISLPIAPIQLAPGDTIGLYIYLLNSASRLSYKSGGPPQSYADAHLGIAMGSGVSHTFGQAYHPRDINVEVFYHHGFRPAGDCNSPRIPVQAEVRNLSVALGQDRTVCEGDTLTPDLPTGTYQWSTGVTTPWVVVDQAGNYWVKVTDADGCQASDTVQLALNPAPIFSLGPDTLVIACGSFPLGIAPTAGHTYLWSTGDITPAITATTPAIYGLTVTDLNGCSYTDTIRVFVNPLPVVDLGPDTTLSVTDSLYLRLSPWGNHIWFDGSTGDLLMRGKDYGVGTHVVWLQFTDPRTGCTGSDTMLVTFTGLMGWADGRGDFGVKVYPNPTQGLVNVAFPIDFPISPTLYLYDLQGRELKHWHRHWIDKQRCMLDLSALPGGAYVLRWQHVEVGQGSIYMLLRE